VKEGSQYWMDFIRQDNETIVSAAKECQHDGQLIFGAIVQLNRNGRILDWISERHSEENDCMRNKLGSMQFNPPPFEPFYMSVQFNLLGYLRKQNKK
jgi:hypothetical protein